MQPTYLFYDIETTGLRKAFDQVLQFGAIRTDANLREIERYELNVRLNPDVVPSPYAMITHQISLQDSEEGMSELDAMKHIHRWMNEPGTISLGYNSLGFDDEFLRFAFYRNLLTPYTHQYANQCSRMDVYPMAVMYFLFKKEVLIWPQNNDRISLKLEDLNKANQLSLGRAHDAMIDVEATLVMAQRFFSEKNMWEQVTSYFNKKLDQERIKNINNQTMNLMVDTAYGPEQHFQYPVLYLGNHRHYKNQMLWLKLDSDKITQPTPENLQDYRLIANKKLAEPGFLLPFNAQFLQYLTSDRYQLAESNKKWLLQNPHVLEQIINYHAEYKYPEYPNVDIEASLYRDGFWNKEEENFCRRFHAVNPDEKAIMTDHVKSPNLKMLASRIIGRHYPDLLTSEQKDLYEEHLQKVHPKNEADALIDYRGEKRLTPSAALKQIEELRVDQGLSPNQLNLLTELENYLRTKFTQ